MLCFTVRDEPRAYLLSMWCISRSNEAIDKQGLRFVKENMKAEDEREGLSGQINIMLLKEDEPDV